MTDKIEYLGDGVYAVYEFGDNGLWLYANDHENPTDKIFIEASVLKSLNEFVEKLKG